MKIIICKGQFAGPISGADETVVTYASQLKAAGISTSVLLIYPYTLDDQYYLSLRKAGVPVYSIASSSARFSLMAGRRMASELLRKFPPLQNHLRKRTLKITSGLTSRYLKPCQDFFEESGADLIHVVTPDFSAMTLIQAAHAAQKPVLYQELGTPYHPPTFKSHYEQFTSVLPLCSEVAALSPRLMKHCRDELPFQNRLSVLPIMAADLGNGHNRFAQPTRPVSFGFAARIEVIKGPMRLIEAFATVHRKMSAVRLRIAGVGSQKQNVARRATALGVGQSCEFTGLYTESDGKNSFLRDLDVFVLPSMTEGTPNGIVEAMAHGLPVIATTVGGIPDVVTRDTGLLVPPGNTAALADAMCQLAGDPKMRAEMGRAGLERYQKFFSPQAVLPMMLNTYRRIAGTNGSPSVTDNAQHARHPWADNFSPGFDRCKTDRKRE